MVLNSIPKAKGAYILILELSNTVSLNLSIGLLTLEKGIYGYIGSARSAGGLYSRIKHHLNKDKKRLWWHIDYLTTREEVKPLHVLYALTEKDVEECVSQVMLENPCWSPAAKGFGSTDKKSYTHLFKCICSEDECVNQASNALKLCTEAEVKIVSFST